MSTSIKLQPTNVSGAIKVRIITNIDEEDGVLVERTAVDLAVACEALMHGEKVFTDVHGDPLKSSVSIRVKRSGRKYSFYPTSVYSKSDSCKVTKFVSELEKLIKEMLAVFVGEVDCEQEKGE